jgi:hypothetical protein
MSITNEEKRLKRNEYMRLWSKKRFNRKDGALPGRPANTSDVLWSKVKICSENECWEWQGFRNEQGYGRTWINDKGYYAHRVIFNLVNPNVINLNAPKSTLEYGFILHTCDNPSCCNPKHLWLGTHKDNMQDKAKKGRTPDFSGGKGPRCKLTMEQAMKARTLRKAGVSTKNLAIQFGISLCSMKTLLANKSYISEF